MGSRHIAFFTDESRAHTFSTLAIAAALVKRGHRVTYATTPHLAPEIAKTGAEAIVYQPLNWSMQIQDERAEAMTTPQDPKNWETMLTFMTPGTMLTALNALPQITDFYNKNKPDVIVHDTDAYAGRILAAINNIPAIQISCYFSFYNNFYTRENCLWCDPPLPEDLRNRLNQFFPIAFPVQDLNIYLIPKEFQFNADSFDERFFFAGPCIQENTLIEKKQKSTEKITILVSRSASASELESNYDYFRIFINAFRDSDFKVILSTGSSLSISKLGEIPENFEINQNTPQSEIISKASIFIGSGGTVSTFEALYHGIPMILIPQDIFHAELSNRVEQLGLGIVIKKKNLSEESIKKSIYDLLSDKEIIGKVKEIQKKITDSKAPDSIADRIENHINLRK